MRYPDGPDLCGSEGSNCQPQFDQPYNSGIIFLLSFWIFSAVYYVAYFYFFGLPRRNPFKLIFNRKTGISYKESDPAYKNDEILLYPYKRLILGDIGYYLAMAISLHWVILVLVVLIDYYNDCQLGSIDKLCFYGNYFITGSFEKNGSIFFSVWLLSSIWYIVWVNFRSSVRDAFRLKVSLDIADSVTVCVPTDKSILSAHVSTLIRHVRKLKNRIGGNQQKMRIKSVQIQKTEYETSYFTHESTRYVIKDGFVSKADYSIGNTFNDIHAKREGLTWEKAQELLNFVGPNEIPFKVDSWMKLIKNEVFSPFYLYQWVTYTVWFWFSYLFIACGLTLVVILSAASKIIVTRSAQTQISRITQHDIDIKALRNGKKSVISSTELVPGDVVIVEDNWEVPCDLIILSGHAICDESNLTGESMPVQKLAAPHTSDLSNINRYKLIAGTKVMQAGGNNEVVHAIVVHTGINTFKGELVSTILYPQEMVFKYDEELPVVVAILLLYALICFILSIQFQEASGSSGTWITRWAYAMFTVSQIVTPILPVALIIGQVQSLSRLKSKAIYCLNPKRIDVSGKVRLFAFDKTGTLTKQGLEFLGVQITDGSGGLIDGFKDPSKDRLPVGVMNGLASCHAVADFQGEIVGNQVEVEMFKSTGWQIIQKPAKPTVVRSIGGTELQIIRKFEFDHTRQTMSVIACDSEGTFHVFTKGSFEKVEKICLPGSVPRNYHKTAQSHAIDGCYVLSLCHRFLNGDENVKTIKRDELERSMVFQSLILFRNELKPDTTRAILQLKRGNVRTIMITGDNSHCGYYIARNSMLANPDFLMYLSHVNSNGAIEWHLMRMEKEPPLSEFKVDFLEGKDYQLKEIYTTEELRAIGDLHEMGIELAVTGKAFEILKKSGFFESFLFDVRIYARFNPNQKVEAVKIYSETLICGYAGDGGNDVGALRMSHVGLALSEAEASVVSPFTTKTNSIMSAVDLLREGRCSLHTSFAVFKFLITYGLLFSLFKLASFWYGVIPSQMMYLMIDIVAIILLGYSMTLSHPLEFLGKERPSSSLLSARHLASVLGVHFINFVFICISISVMSSNPDYVRWPAKFANGAQWWTLGDNWESTFIYCTIYFQFISSALFFTYGSTYRRSDNYILATSYVFLIILNSYLLLANSNPFTQQWHMATEDFNGNNTQSPVWKKWQEAGNPTSPSMPISLRWALWGLCLVNMFVSAIWQVYVVDGPIGRKFKVKNPSRRPKFGL